MRSQILLAATAVPFLVAAPAAGRAAGRRRGHPLPGPRDRRVQRARGRRRAARHHQRLGRHRPALHRRPGTGRDRGRHAVVRRARGRRGPGPRGRRRGLGRRHRRQPRRAGLGLGRAGPGRARFPRRRRADVRAGLPGGARATPSRCSRDPATDQLYVISKGVFGGAVYAAPGRLSADRPNRLTRGRPGAADRDRRGVLPRRPARDRARVLRGGRLLVAGARAAGPVRAAAPTAGRGHRCRRRRHDLRLVGGPARAGAAHRAAGRRPAGHGGGPASPSPTPSASPEPSPDARARPSQTPPPGTRQGTELPEQDAGPRSAWGWAVGGLLGLGIVVVLVRALRPR